VINTTLLLLTKWPRNLPHSFHIEICLNSIIIRTCAYTCSVNCTVRVCCTAVRLVVLCFTVLFVVQRYLFDVCVLFICCSKFFLLSYRMFICSQVKSLSHLCDDVSSNVFPSLLCSLVCNNNNNKI